MDLFLNALRAIAEPTRLRILSLCAHAELTVSDLTGLLGQSQPRVSRHLRLLVEAGVLERHQEGNWARYRLAGWQSSGKGCAVSKLADTVVDLLPRTEDAGELARDLERLEELRQQREATAAAYFEENAADWDRLRALHVDETAVADALANALSERPVGRLLDIGTGTGRVLRDLAADATNAVGLDLSSAMLAIARAGIERDGLRHCQVRQGDMYRIPYGEAAFDTVTAHMVLHYAERPEDVLAEAYRVLSPAGRLILVDFETHNIAALKEEHRHAWPGFSDTQIASWCDQAGLAACGPPIRLEGGALTVRVWQAEKPSAAFAAASDDQRGVAE